MELIIAQPNGWKKTYRFDKAVVRIGSATANDIQLTSPGIIPIHLQIIHVLETPGNCKVLNLGPAVQLESGGKASTLDFSTTVYVRDGDQLVLDEHRILFHLPLSSEIALSSNLIAASLSLKDAVLCSQIPAVGFLHLKNLGMSPNCQFQVTVNGLSEECYRIDPLPVLYPGAEEDVRIQFFHRSTTPPAGYQVITISVSAPTNYPGEQVILRQGLYVSPLLKTGIHVVDDMSMSKGGTAEMPISPQESTNPTVLLDILTPPLSKNAAQGFEKVPEPDPSEPAILDRKNIIASKVVRNPTETYWEEKS